MGQNKAGLLNRAVSFMIDLVVAGGLSSIPHMGFVASVFYVAVRDGFTGGQSLGKRLVGLRVILPDQDRRVGFRESIFRNIPFIVARVLWAIPLVGWILAGLIVVFEGLLVIGSPTGARLGDSLARTQIVEDV